MNLKELKDKIDELWNQADVETKVDRNVYIHDNHTYNYNYHDIEDIYIDSDKDIIINIDFNNII